MTRVTTAAVQWLEVWDRLSTAYPFDATRIQLHVAADQLRDALRTVGAVPPARAGDQA